MTPSAETKSVAEVLYFPRCTFSNRWESGDIVLLLGRAFKKRLDCGYWGAVNWFSLHAFGFGYEGVERVDMNSPEPFPYIEGEALGVGKIAVIGGPRWEKAFPEFAEPLRQAAALAQEPRDALA